MESEEIKDAVLYEETMFPKLFSHFEERDWGILFFNENAAESHDSNHAVFFADRVGDFESVLIEIKDFYLSKNLTPRIYQPFLNGFFAEKAEALKRHGFDAEIYGYTDFFVLTQENGIEKTIDLDIRRIEEWDERIITDIYLPADESYAIEPERMSIKNDNFYLFAGFKGEKAVSLLSFHTAVSCTRFDYVITPPEHRQKGYAKEMMRYATEYCKQNGFLNPYAFFMNPYSKKISVKAGFRKSFCVETGSAYYKNPREALK